MPVFYIFSAIAFIFYLQTGLLVLWKNVKSPLNRWFFVVSVYLALLSVLFTVTFPFHAETFWFSMLVRMSWCMFPVMMFRFHFLLTGIPEKKSIYYKWYFVLLSLGLIILLFSISFLFSTGTSDYHHLDDWFFFQLVWYYLFFGLFLVTVGSVVYHHIKWRKRQSVYWQRFKFSYVFFAFLVSAFLDFFFFIFFPDGIIGHYIKMPHVFLLPWFTGIVYIYLRHGFSAPDPAVAALKILNDLPQVVFFCDMKSVINETNPFTINLLGMEGGQLKKSNVEKLFAEQSMIRMLIRNALSAGHSGPEELHLNHNSGRAIPVSVSCALLKDGFDDIYGIAIYGKDNSQSLVLQKEIARREQMERSLRSLSQNLEAEVAWRTGEMRRSLEAAERKVYERIKAEQKIKLEIEEIEIMLGEIHNRIRKNINLVLSMLDLSIFGSNNPAESTQSKTLFQRIHCILLINKQIQTGSNYGMVDFRRFLELLIDNHSGNDSKLRFELVADPHMLWMDQAVPLAIAVNEFFTIFTGFMFDHRCSADSGLLIKYLKEDGWECSLHISAGCKGFSAGGMNPGNNSWNIQLAEMLIRDQLGGELTIKNLSELSVSIKIPVLESRQGHYGVEP